MSRYNEDETERELSDNDLSEDEVTRLEQVENEMTRDSKGRRQISLSDEMVLNLRQFIDLCEQIKGVKEDLKILVERKTELEGIISQFMISNEIPVFNTPNGRIAIQNSTTKKPLNKEMLLDIIQTKISDTRIAQELTELAFSKRPTSQVQKIRHVPERNNNR